MEADLLEENKKLRQLIHDMDRGIVVIASHLSQHPSDRFIRSVGAEIMKLSDGYRTAVANI